VGQRGPIASVTVMPGMERTDRPRPSRVTLDPAPPDRPSDLCVEALEEWDRVVPDLNAKGLLAKVDRAVLVTYCDAVAKQRLARRMLDVEGLMSTGQKGEPIKHPLWMVYTQSGTLIAQLAKELFASPNARLRSQLPEAPDVETEGADILD
jgi:P27 family predicted phage terminase small subunit